MLKRLTNFKNKQVFLDKELQQIVGDVETGKSLYSYNYRIADRYNLPVVSMAVFADYVFA